jgi:archaetidylinositol phosphate synthase
MLHKLDQKTNIRSKLLRPFAININPNIVTFFAFLCAIAAGLSFYYHYLVYAIIFILLNGFFDALDGEVARKRGPTLLGDFLDHVSDRIADVIILLGIIFGGYAPEQLGFFLIIITLLVSYLGTEAQALSKQRLYGGLVGRAERLVIIMIVSILELYYPGVIYDGILVLLALSIITFIQRFIQIYRDLK